MMFSNLSLRAKTVLIAALPSFVYLFMAASDIRFNWQQMSDATRLQGNVEVVKGISGFVHEVQKERGRSSAYLNNGATSEELKSARLDSDKALGVLKAALAKQDSDEFRSKIDRLVTPISQLRGQIDQRTVSGAEAVKTYSGMVAGMIELESVLVSGGSAAEIKSLVHSLEVLEMAKESAGRLRAQISGILAANGAITPEQMNAIVVLRGNVEGTLNLPGLQVTDGTRSGLKAFSSSPSWVNVQKTFARVAKNSDIGMYNSDPREFFREISKSIDELALMVNSEVSHLEAKAESHANEARTAALTLIAFTFALTFGITLAVWAFVRAITRSMNQAIEDLSASTSQVAGASSELHASSEQIASAATESASSLQQTVSALEEISKMIAKNSESADVVRKMSENSKDNALTGKSVMEEMTAAIEDINVGNTNIMKQIEESNEQISGIVRMIGEISEKTKVINDIVFQTRLLSFNASVEAARAGEHGKGFAVVAEEVGNLAQMSGKASQEISALLDESVRKVNETVSATKTKVGELVGVGKEKVDRGVEVSHRCVQVLDRIVEDVSSVNDLVGEISTASKEQAVGVEEINKAMAQLDQTTHQNVAASEQSAQSASQLATEGQSLSNVVLGMKKLIFGSASVRESHVHEAAPAKKGAAVSNSTPKAA